MKTFLESSFWLTTFKVNAVLFVIAFSINWMENPGHHLINHDYYTYWYVAGGSFFLFVNLIFYLFLKFILKK